MDLATCAPGEMMLLKVGISSPIVDTLQEEVTECRVEVSRPKKAEISRSSVSTSNVCPFGLFCFVVLALLSRRKRRRRPF